MTHARMSIVNAKFVQYDYKGLGNPNRDHFTANGNSVNLSQQTVK